jgi:hypothetical protein
MLGFRITESLLCRFPIGIHLSACSTMINIIYSTLFGFSEVPKDLKCKCEM